MYQHGVVLGAAVRRHVKHVPHHRVAAADVTRAAQRDAFACHRRPPSSAALCLRLRRPSSGSIAAMVRAVTEPILTKSLVDDYYFFLNTVLKSYFILTTNHFRS